MLPLIPAALISQAPQSLAPFPGDAWPEDLLQSWLNALESYPGTICILSGPQPPLINRGVMPNGQPHPPVRWSQGLVERLADAGGMEVRKMQNGLLLVPDLRFTQAAHPKGRFWGLVENPSDLTKIARGWTSVEDLSRESQRIIRYVAEDNVADASASAIVRTAPYLRISYPDGCAESMPIEPDLMFSEALPTAPPAQPIEVRSPTGSTLDFPRPSAPRLASLIADGRNAFSLEINADHRIGLTRLVVKGSLSQEDFAAIIDAASRTMPLVVQPRQAVRTGSARAEHSGRVLDALIAAMGSSPLERFRSPQKVQVRELLALFPRLGANSHGGPPQVLDAWVLAQAETAIETRTEYGSGVYSLGPAE